MGHNQRIKRERRRQWLIALSLVIVVGVGAYVLSMLYEQNERLSVTFVHPQSQARVRYSLEVADTPAKREKGLMFRKSLERHGGMIFFQPEDSIQKFWMSNTFISLDMIFIDKDKHVVGVLDSVPILNNEPRFVDVPSRYVVELAAGSAKRDGIVVGSDAQFTPK